MTDTDAFPAALLLLTDGRFPTGAYAHSGGLEAAVLSGRVQDAADLKSFLRGRLHTAGVLASSFAAASCAAATDGDGDRIRALEAELDARTPSPSLRQVSRALGRQLLRAMTGIAPHVALTALPLQPHQAVAMGGAAAALGASPHAAALAAAYDAVTGPAGAALKLLPLDPFTVNAMLARLMPDLDCIARVAAQHADAVPHELPAPGSPLLDVGAEQHARRDARLFAS